MVDNKIKCSFCSLPKSPLTKVVENTANGKCICEHCVRKFKGLLEHDAKNGRNKNSILYVIE